METYVILNSTGSTVITGGNSASQTSTETGTPTQASPGLFGNIGWSWIVIYIVVIGGYIWFISRNNKKKEKKIEEMRSSLKVGDTVCTTGGMFGKIAEVGESTFIIEFGTNRGVRVPVSKQDVVPAKDPLVAGAKKELSDSEEN